MADMTKPILLDETGQAINKTLQGIYGLMAKEGEEFYNEGFAAGEKSEYDRFWDALQQSGQRTNYRCAFEECYFTHIDPKYPIAANEAGCIMQKARKLVSVDWSKFDLSRTSSLYYAFAYCNSLKEIDTELGMINGTPTLMDGLCYHCNSLVSVKKVVASPDYAWGLSFYMCTALEEIRFDGEIGYVEYRGLNFQHSTKLSRESITSIINALSTTISGRSVTFSKTAVNTAFEMSSGASDGSTSTEWTTLANTKSNWTINLV